jgi:hypothetical protein
MATVIPKFVAAHQFEQSVRIFVAQKNFATVDQSAQFLFVRK